MNLSDIKTEICQLLKVDKITAKEAKQLNLISDVNWSLKETWLNLLNALRATECNDVNLGEAETVESSKPVESSKITNDIEDSLLGFLIELKLVSFTNLIAFNYKQQVVINHILNLIKLQPKAPSNCYNWHYLEHIATGSYKQISSTQELNDLYKLIDTLNGILEPVKQIRFSKSVLKIQMKPKHITIEDVNGRILSRIEKQAQKNNDYGNIRHTIMSTKESPGRNVGQASVKESVLYKPAKLIAEPFIRNGKANINGILSISVNGHQVYPCSLVTYLDESNPALDLLDDATKELISSSNKLKVDELTPQQLASLKTYKRRKEIASEKVKQYSFNHTRGKIHNGFSPAFETNGKKYCLEIDKTNRVRLWQLSNDASSTVSANELIKGRLVADIGYLEVKPYVVKQWINLTLDMIKGGSEARKETFNWIAQNLNHQILPSDKHTFTYLQNLKDSKGNHLIINNLKVINEVITGSLYDSELIIAKREVKRNKVVLHPTAKVLEQYLIIANIWVNSLPNNGYFTDRPNNLGLNNVNNRTRVGYSTKEGKQQTSISPRKNKMYLIKMLRRFTDEGIYADKDKSQYLGKLVKTDGSSLLGTKIVTEKEITFIQGKEVIKETKTQVIDDSLIEKIVTRVLDTFPIDQNIATLFTPSHYQNKDEFVPAFLKLLKLYGQVELGILLNGKIQLGTDNNDTNFINWCKSLYSYLKSNNKAVEVITVGDAIEMLQKSSYSKLKGLLLSNIPSTATLNPNVLLSDVTGHNKTKIKSFQAEIEKLSSMYASLTYDIRSKNGLENE